MSRRRFKSSTMKFGVPLAVAGSRYVEPCYGLHGKGYGAHPPRGADIDLILINPCRQLWFACGHFPGPHKYRTDAVPAHSGWRVLGWRMTDGSMPLGDYDAIDPELAQIDYLPSPNAPDALERGPDTDGFTCGYLHSPGGRRAPVNCDPAHECSWEQAAVGDA